LKKTVAEFKKTFREVKKALEHLESSVVGKKGKYYVKRKAQYAELSEQKKFLELLLGKSLD
jgi:hypothetical protein